jgi:hypothetical protein
MHKGPFHLAPRFATIFVRVKVALHADHSQISAREVSVSGRLPSPVFGQPL